MMKTALITGIKGDDHAFMLFLEAKGTHWSHSRMRD